MIVVCLKCGIQQDPESPICIHLAAAKGGRRAAPVVRERYGLEHYRRAGRLGTAAARAARLGKKPHDAKP